MSFSRWKKPISMATMRCVPLFLVICTFLVKESSAYSSSTACALVDGKWVCQNDQNNGNGNAAAAISTGGKGDVYAGPIAVNNDPMAYNNDQQEIYDEPIPYNNAPFPGNNGQMVRSGVWAGPIPNNNDFIPNFNEILRNPFKMLNFPQRPQN